MAENKMKKILQDNQICAILRNVPTQKAVSYAKAAYKGGIRMFEVAGRSKADQAAAGCSGGSGVCRSRYGDQ